MLIIWMLNDTKDSNKFNLKGELKMVYCLVCERDKIDDAKNEKVRFDIVDFESEENFKNHIESLKKEYIVYYNEESKTWTVIESGVSDFDIIKDTTYKLVDNNDVMTYSADWEPTSFSFII